MIKIYNAYTEEIDEPEIAVQEICEQLVIKKNQLKNTIGIIHFYYEFAEAGICQALMDALPFELIGCVSSHIGTKGKYGEIALSITMITSDDVSFSIHTLENMDKKQTDVISDEITQLYTRLCEKEKPKMVMPFLTPLPQFSGDELMETANAMPDPLILFGTVAFNAEVKQSSNLVLAKDKISSNMYAFIAFYGDMNPKFRITTSFAFEEDFANMGEITDAEGPTLKSVDGISAVEYLKRQGMINQNNELDNAGIWAVPAILTYPNGMKVVRAFLGIVEGTNYLFSTGKIEVGAKVKFAFLNAEKTLASADILMNELIEAKENNILAYSCAARAWALGSNLFAETQKMADCADIYRQKHNETMHYNMAYSGGEICPDFDEDGKFINVLHNYTLVSCSLN